MRALREWIGGLSDGRGFKGKLQAGEQGVGTGRASTVRMLSGEYNCSVGQGERRGSLREEYRRRIPEESRAEEWLERLGLSCLRWG